MTRRAFVALAAAWVGASFADSAAPQRIEIRARKFEFVPGKVIEVTITPAEAGRYHFLCDNFCGEGHDRMSGILIVGD
jgi:hypothetical protein